jgi:hypothetical protein
MMIALYIVGGIVLLVVLLVLLAPTDFKMEQSITINRPKDQVFPYLKLLKNQDNWSVWNMKDPNMKQELRGTDGTVGAVNAWDSTDKNVGAGEQEITKITEGSRVDFELRFLRPMQATNYSYLIATPVGNASTEVTWGFYGKAKRPMNAMSMLMKGMLNKAFSDGLANLKKVLEK